MTAATISASDISTPSTSTARTASIEVMLLLVVLEIVFMRAWTAGADPKSRPAPARRGRLVVVLRRLGVRQLRLRPRHALAELSQDAGLQLRVPRGEHVEVLAQVLRLALQRLDLLVDRVLHDELRVVGQVDGLRRVEVPADLGLAEHQAGALLAEPLLDRPARAGLHQAPDEPLEAVEHRLVELIELAVLAVSAGALREHGCVELALGDRLFGLLDLVLDDALVHDSPGRLGHRLGILLAVAR